MGYKRVSNAWVNFNIHYVLYIGLILSMFVLMTVELSAFDLIVKCPSPGQPFARKFPTGMSGLRFDRAINISK